jgi:hypothetical protein
MIVMRICATVPASSWPLLSAQVLRVLKRFMCYAGLLHDVLYVWGDLPAVITPFHLPGSVCHEPFNRLMVMVM